MSEKTKIEWADHTASPWHGCAEVHAGCDHCYARTMAKRNPGTLGVWGPDGTRVRSASFDANCRRWNRAAEKAGVRASVFPSICDPFEDWQGPILNAQGGRMMHDHRGNAGEEPAWVTMDDLRRDLFATIDACPWLDFYLLTKRPENLQRMWPEKRFDASGWNGTLAGYWHDRERKFYRPNVYLLTSISDQATADTMIPHLLACRDLVPVLGASAEPLLGPVDMAQITIRRDGEVPNPLSRVLGDWIDPLNGAFTDSPRLDWIIVGGESGPGARPMHPDWVRSIRDQCVAAGTAFFFKQWGEYAPLGKASGLDPDHYFPGRDKRVSVHGGVPMDEPTSMFLVGKKIAGRVLDGRTWDEVPKVSVKSCP